MGRALPGRGDPVPLTLVLLGAADRLCEAVVVGRLERDAAVETLVSLRDP